MPNHDSDELLSQVYEETVERQPPVQGIAWRALLLAGVNFAAAGILVGIVSGWLIFSPSKENQMATATQQQSAPVEQAPARQEEKPQASVGDTITVSAPAAEQPVQPTKPSIQGQDGLMADFTDSKAVVTDGKTSRNYENVKTVRFPGNGIVTVIYEDGKAIAYDFGSGAEIGQ